MNKLKKILFLIFVIVTSIYFIYFFYHDKTISYIALGDAFALGENPYGEVTSGYADFLTEKLKKDKKIRLFTKNFAVKDYYISNLTEDIISDKRILIENKSLSLKSALRESNFITLSIGANDVLSQMSFRHVDNLSKTDEEIVKDISKSTKTLLKEITKYNKNIILVGYHNFYMNKNNSKIFKLLNKEYKKLATSYGIIYIDTYKFIDEKYLENPNSFHLNQKGYKLIADEIYKAIKND